MKTIKPIIRLLMILAILAAFTFNLWAQTNAPIDPGTLAPPPEDVSAALTNLLHVLFPKLSVTSIAEFIAELFIIARLLRKAVPDNLQNGRIGTLLKHAALEINPPPAVTPPKPSPVNAGIVSLLLFAGLAIGVTGCQSSNARLAQGGAYAPVQIVYVTNAPPDGGPITILTNTVPTQAPDFAFYATDAAFDLAYSTVNAAFQFEYDNRAMLWQVSPSIKHAIDAIRPQAAAAVSAWAKARQHYLANPTTAGLGTLQTLLSEVQSAAQAALIAVPQIGSTVK